MHMRTVPLAIMVLCAIVTHGCTAVHDSLSERAGQQLEQVIAYYQNGELESAWEAYSAFFNHPSNSDVNVDAFGRCFFIQECPPLGALAYILGKSEADAGNFHDFCPDWQGLDKTGLSEEELRTGYELAYSFREIALEGTCEQWAKRNAAMFDARPRKRWRDPQVLPLVRLSPEDTRPAIVAKILRTPVTGLVDTGASMSFLNRAWSDKAPEAFEFIQDMRVEFIGHLDMASVARIQNMQLGNEAFPRPVVVLGEVRVIESGLNAAAEMGNIFGMNLLLQYRSVCFDWEQNKLHLGTLGACEGGEAPYRNWLTGTQLIGIDAGLSTDTKYTAEIDTGSDTTYCSQWLMRRYKDHTFSFGDSSALTGECTYSPHVLFRDSETSQDSHTRHILLGMDTLNQFSAFGWELNPLRVYFVPKASDQDQSGIGTPHRGHSKGGRT